MKKENIAESSMDTTMTDNSGEFDLNSPYETMFTELPEMLNTRLLCQALNCSEKYVYKLIREGKLIKFPDFRSVRVPKFSLINFVLGIQNDIEESV